jgi:elongator complex protein 3
VRQAIVTEDELHLVVHAYETSVGQEQFLGYETAEGKLAGFLRLSLPARETFEVVETSKVWDKIWDVLPEIHGAAMIREVHIYGPALEIGADSAGEAQHLGLGRRLIAEAQQRARQAGFERLAVISAIGTRRYYEGVGFERGECYMMTRV